MKYRIENKSAFRVVGIKKNFPIMGDQTAEDYYCEVWLPVKAL